MANYDKFKGFKKWSGTTSQDEKSGTPLIGAFERWLASYERWCKAQKIPNEERSANLIFAMETEMLSRMESAEKPGGGEEPAWDDVKKTMKGIWGIQGGDKTVFEALEGRKQKPGESVGAYADEFLSLMKLLSELNEPRVWTGRFYHGLGERYKDYLFPIKDSAESIDTIVRLCTALEERFPDMLKPTTPKAVEPVLYAGPSKWKSRDQVQRGGHRGSEKPKQGWSSESQHRRDLKEGQCFNCHKKGHLKKDCSEPALVASESSQYKVRNDREILVDDLKMGSVNHEECSCNRGVVEGVFVVLTRALAQEIHVDFTTEDGKRERALVDTGAGPTLVSRETAARWKRQGLTSDTETSTRKFQSAGGEPLQVDGRSYIKVKVDKNETRTEFFIIDSLPRDIIFGRDVLSDLSAVIFSRFRKVAFPDADVLVRWAEEAGICTRKEPEPSDPPCKDGECILLVATTSEVDIKPQTRRSPNPAALTQVNWGPAFPNLKDDMMKVAYEFSDCFSRNQEDYSDYTGEPTKLELKGPLQPFRQPPRTLAMVYEEFARAEEEKWIKTNRIRPSNSPVAVSAHVVAREISPGQPVKLRYVINFPPLNRQLKDDPYPVGDAENIFDHVHGAVVFSKVDFKDAFLSMPLDEKSKWLTSFVTPTGQYEFNFVPWGLKTAPAALSRAVSETTRRLSRIFPFADDVLLAPNREEEIVAQFRAFMERVRQSGLLLKPEKCFFLFDEITFLGRRLTKYSVGPDIDTADVANRWKVPDTIEGLDKFLGLARWYACFIKQYAAIAKPLYSLLTATGARKKVDGKPVSPNTKLDWKTEHLQAFNRVKKAVVTALPLALIKPGVPFVVETDASRMALGGVLRQGGRVVKMTHRALRPSETQTAITLLELKAVLFACEKWKKYLIGQKFKIVTDHIALLWLKQQLETGGKLGEWATDLLPFDFDIEYRPGAALGLADAITRRLELAAPVLEALEALPTKQELVTAQRSDQFCQHVIHELNMKDRTTLDKYVMNELGILCHLTHARSNPVLRPVIPPVLREQVLRAVHLEAGHAGRETARRAAASFYWQNMSDDAEAYTRSCIRCQARNKPAPSRKLPTGTVEAQKPNEIVAVDVTAGFWPTKEGYQYILVMSDIFSRYKAATPLRTKTSAEIATAFQQTWVDKHGWPAQIHTDQGPEFSAEFADVLRRNGVKKSWTTSYHPQGDGQVERFNQSLINMLAKYINKQDEWATRIHDCIYAYNTSKHSSTGHTPALLFTGKEEQTIGAALAGQRETSKSQTPRAAETARRQVLNEQRKAASDRDEANKETIKFTSGQLVMVKRQVTMEERFSKLQSPFIGPCRIIKIKSPTNVVVQQIKGGFSGTVHIKNIKGYYPAYSTRQGGKPPRSGQSQQSPAAQTQQADLEDDAVIITTTPAKENGISDGDLNPNEPTQQSDTTQHQQQSSESISISTQPTEIGARATPATVPPSTTEADATRSTGLNETTVTAAETAELDINGGQQTSSIDTEAASGRQASGQTASSGTEVVTTTPRQSDSTSTNQAASQSASRTDKGSSRAERKSTEPSFTEIPGGAGQRHSSQQSITAISEVKRSKSGRVTKAPARYEP